MRWDIETIDTAVATAVGVALALGALFLLIWLRKGLRDGFDYAGSELALIAVGIAGGVFAVFVAYGTLRNQAMQSAETSINQDGGRLLDWERESFAVRCVYGWYDKREAASPAIADECLALIVSNRENWSEVLLYIEEVFFNLQQAQSDQQRWGSNYAENVRYWRDDVSDDVTGLFSFHLVNRYPLAGTTEGPETNMKQAGVKIDALCDRAERVRVCLEATGRFAELGEYCARRPPHRESMEGLDRLAQVCRDAARVSHEAYAGSLAR